MPLTPLRTVSLRLELVSLAPGEEFVISNLRFCNITYLALYLDEVNVLRDDARFEDSWLVWQELANSATQSGQYLLFTSLTGIADEGGWEYVQVFHQREHVEWSFRRDEEQLAYRFDKPAYVAAIQYIERVLTLTAPGLPLVPEHVLFPEE